VAAGLTAAGARGRVGGWGWDLDGMPFAGPTDEVLARQEETVKALAPGGLVTGWVTLVGHSLASDALFAGAAELADQLDVGLTLHMSPGENDIAAYAERSGLRPLEHLDRLGVLGPRLVLGHAVWLDDHELELALGSRTAIASCPGAYVRLGQGYSRGGRHGEFVRRGGRLALGCDSHNAGDAPDVLHAAYLLAALERDRGTQNALRADQAFALATVDGAHAVGLGAVTGSIEVGKAADLVVLDTRSPGWMPRGELALQLVWGSVSSSVRDVVVDGEVVVRDALPTRVDIDAVRAAAAERSAALLRRAGIDVPSRWTVVQP
jgi:5-methylthioadenosine/S-adenosylhomocysteine deaminase